MPALAFHRRWRPAPGQPIDLEATVEAFLRELHATYSLKTVLYDPFQMARSMKTLADAGLPVEEFPQTVGNTSRMGQALFEVLKGRNLALYPSDELREQALHTVAIETAQGFRIAKERASKKVDAIAAMAMAVYACVRSGPSFPAADVGLSPEELDRPRAPEPSTERRRSIFDLPPVGSTDERGTPLNAEDEELIRERLGQGRRMGRGLPDRMWRH